VYRSCIVHIQVKRRRPVWIPRAMAQSFLSVFLANYYPTIAKCCCQCIQIVIGQEQVAVLAFDMQVLPSQFVKRHRVVSEARPLAPFSSRVCFLHSPLPCTSA
jgi:hypothetical protein